MICRHILGEEVALFTANCGKSFIFCLKVEAINKIQFESGDKFR